VSASLGIAVLPPCAGTRLLMEADAAMYHVKRNGGNDYQFYTDLVFGRFSWCQNRFSRHY